jgi:pilus assembly protein CpaB
VLGVFPSLGRLGTSPSSARLLRRGRFVAAGACLLLAGVTALGSSRTHARAPAPAGTPVLVAARDLPAGHVLGRADLIERSWPRALPAGAAIPRLSGALGDRLASPLRRGEPLTTTRLTTGRLTTGLPGDSVAVSVPLAGSTGGLVHAGDTVDLIPLAQADFPAGSAAARPRGVEVVARDVLVLATLPPAVDGTDERVIVGTSRALAVRLAGLSAAHEFAVVLESF